MRALRGFPAAVPALACFVALCGCRQTAPPRDATPSELRAAPSSQIAARQSADARRLAIRFQVRGRDVYAIADIVPAGTGEPAPGAATLNFSREARGEFRRLRTRGNRNSVPVLPHAAWNRLSRRLTERLAPAHPGTATLVVAAGREMLIVRLPDRRLDVRPLVRRRTPGARIVRTVRGAEFLREMDAVLAGDAAGATALRGPVLLTTGGVPALILIDRPRNRLAFLHIPEGQSGGLPLPNMQIAETTARGLFSLGWRSGVLPVLRNPFSTVSRTAVNVLTAAQAEGYRMLLRLLPAIPPPPLNDGPPMDLAQWERDLDRMVSAPAVPATLRFRIGGGEFFPDFVRAVQEARRTVDIQTYIFDNDGFALGIADLLRARSHDVRVRLLLDEAASLQAALTDPPGMPPRTGPAPAGIVDYLRRDSRMQVRPMSMTGLAANHAKIIVIDEAIAWLGGMNIGHEYRQGWHDMMIEVRGPLVRWIRDDFERTWAHAGWGGDYAALWRRIADRDRTSRQPPAPPGAVPVRPLYTSAWRHDILQAQIEALRRARRYAYIQNAYTSDLGFLLEMIRARARGVDVRLILPEDTDSLLMSANNRAILPLLLRHGVRVFSLPGMSHIKAAVIDGWACVGSANYDRLSLRVNDEFSVGFSDPQNVRILMRDLFDRDFRRSQEITDIPGSDLLDSLLQTLASQL